MRASGWRAWRWWWPTVGALTVVGLGVRLASVYSTPDKPAGGDPYVYHATANLLARGVFYVNVTDYFASGAHHQVPAAAYAPLFSAVLAVPSALGATSFLAARVWCCVLGAAAVPLGALLGRRVGSPRAGLVAGLVIALYPNLWMSDGLVLSEALTPVLILLVLLAAHHCWSRRSVKSAALLGAALAAAALNHDELALLGPLVLLPLALGARASWKHRVALLGAGVLAFGLVVGPWVGWNLTRFSRPVFISDGIGITLLSADCNQTWYGPLVGYWSIQCALQAPQHAAADESVRSAQDESTAIHYVEHHLGSLPRVTAAKVGRGLGLYHPIQQIELDHNIETRPLLWAEVGLGTYYALALLSVGGVVLLRRRGLPVYPMVAVGVVTVVTMAIGFGQTRYRTALEVPLVLLASVAVDALIGQARRRRSLPAGTEALPADREPVPSP